MPGVLDTFTGSSGRFAELHFAVIAGSAAMPTWAMNPGSTRKNAAPS